MAFFPAIALGNGSATEFTFGRTHRIGPGTGLETGTPQRDTKGPAVVAARIDLHDFVDLLDQVDMDLVSGYARKFETRMAQLGSRLKNKYPVHRLDCAVFNFLTNVLSSRGRGVRGYRAACVEGKAITTDSPIYDRSHVQLAVIDQDAILEKWIV